MTKSILYTLKDEIAYYARENGIELTKEQANTIANKTIGYMFDLVLKTENGEPNMKDVFESIFDTN